MVMEQPFLQRISLRELPGPHFQKITSSKGSEFKYVPLSHSSSKIMKMHCRVWELVMGFSWVGGPFPTYAPIWSGVTCVVSQIYMSAISQKVKKAYGALLSISSVIRSDLKQNSNNKTLCFEYRTPWLSLLLCEHIYEKSLFCPAGVTFISIATEYFQRWKAKPDSFCNEQSQGRIGAERMVTEEKPDPILLQWLLRTKPKTSCFRQKKNGKKSLLTWASCRVRVQLLLSRICPTES